MKAQTWETIVMCVLLFLGAWGLLGIYTRSKYTRVCIVELVTGERKEEQGCNGLHGFVSCDGISYPATQVKWYLCRLEANS